MPRRMDHDKDKIAALGAAAALLAQGFRQAEDGAAAVNNGLVRSAVGSVVAVTGGGPLTPARLLRGNAAADEVGRQLGAALRQRFLLHELDRAVRDGSRAMEDVALRIADEGLPGEGAEEDEDGRAAILLLLLAGGLGLAGRIRAALLQAFTGGQDVPGALTWTLRENERHVRTAARTAYSLAWHRSAFRRLTAASGGNRQYLKALVAIHDTRTHWDSLFAEAQPPRPLDELFVDGMGRRYLHPPGRPNDRETMVPWLGTWGAWPFAGGE